MAKDSYWFRHDSTRGRSLELLKLKAIYGHFGTGVYWDIAEILREQEGYRWPENDRDLSFLAKIIDCDPASFKNIVQDCKLIGLFKSDGQFFHDQILTDDMVVWETKCENAKKAKAKRNASGIEAESERIESENPPNIHTYIHTNNISSDAGSEVLTKVKEKEDAIPFEQFWDLYGKKVDRKPCERKWNRLKKSDQEQVLRSIPGYKASCREVTYMKNPETYLNKESWKNETAAVQDEAEINRRFHEKHQRFVNGA